MRLIFYYINFKNTPCWKFFYRCTIFLVCCCTPFTLIKLCVYYFKCIWESLTNIYLALLNLLLTRFSKTIYYLHIYYFTLPIIDFNFTRKKKFIWCWIFLVKKVPKSKRMNRLCSFPKLCKCQRRVIFYGSDNRFQVTII